MQNDVQYPLVLYESRKIVETLYVIESYFYIFRFQLSSKSGGITENIQKQRTSKNAVR